MAGGADELVFDGYSCFISPEQSGFQVLVK